MTDGAVITGEGSSRWRARIVILWGAYAVAVGVAALVGWLANVERLTDWKGDGIAMFPNTAICAAMSGVAVIVAAAGARRFRTAMRILASLVAIIGGLTLLEHATGANLGLDTLLFDRPWGQAAAAAPMRMGPPASLAFLVVGLALLLLTLGPSARRLAAILGTAVVGIGTLSVTGHLYGASSMYMIPRVTGIAMQTATAVVALGFGLLASVPEREPMRRLLEPGAAGVLVRRALPVIIAVSLALGAGRIYIERQHLVDAPFGTALRTVLELFVLTAILWWATAGVRTQEEARQASEADVRRHGAQLAAFLDTAAIALHRVGPDGAILWANDAELRLLGYRTEEYVGHHIAEFHVDQAVIADILARLHRGEKLYEYPARMRCRDGSIKDVLVDASVLWDEGRFVHTQSFTRDVTEQKRADGTRALLAAIVQASDDAIVSTTVDGVITSWNAGAERLFGYTGVEAIGRPVAMLMPARRRTEEPDILARVRRGERIEHYETIRRRKDGTLIDVSLTVSPIHDADGRVVGASKIARDVTEQKRAAERTRLDQEAMARLYEIGKRCVRPDDRMEETLGEILDAALWIAGGEKGAVQIYDEVSGALVPAVHRGLEPPFVEFFREVRAGEAAACGTALALSERVIVEDVRTSAVYAGQPTLEVLVAAGVLAVQSTPLVSSTGTVLGMVSTLYGAPHRPTERECRLLDVLARQTADYLERKSSEEHREELLRMTQQARNEAEAASRAKDEFLAMLAHELRNPLSAVRNAIAAASLDEASRGRALEIARRQTDQLGRIVEDLLDVARITRGRVPLRKERIVLGDALQRAVEGSRGLMDERGHTLTVSLPPETIELHADPARLEQAIANLLINAAKYTDPGGAVSVVAERDGTSAVIRVRDNGMGIAPDVLPRVFELFAQSERSLDRAQGGLGIGLTLVRRIVELHGGAVEAHSQGVDRGAEFVIRLPALHPAPATIGEPAAPARTARARRRARVLMVEDNPDAAESLVMILELLGHHVRVVHDGRAGVDAARANVPDIMLIDIGLPGMNGYDVARAIRRDPQLKHLLLVALTGYGRPEDKAQAMAAGFDYHLVKPVDLDALGDLIARLGSGERTTTATHGADQKDRGRPAVAPGGLVAPSRGRAGGTTIS